jgi:heat shock protein HtpX
MAMIKRVFLFALTNILVLVSLSFAFNVICRFFGITPAAYYDYLLLFSVVMGFGGAFFSLMISKWSAKTMMGVRIIDPQTSDASLRRVVDRVYEYSRAARLSKMPEVGIYESQDVNAFATGPSRNNSLVAVSTGLLHRMETDEVDGVLAHEVAHIANGDMVTMTLLQGVINAVVIFFARVVANIVASQGRSNGDSGPNPVLYMATVFILEIIFSALGMIVVNYFSRAREFRADAGGARYAGTQKMAGALRALQGTVGRMPPEQESLATLKISGRSRGALMALFSTHPPLEERIRRLERLST